MWFQEKSIAFSLAILALGLLSGASLGRSVRRNRLAIEREERGTFSKHLLYIALAATIFGGWLRFKGLDFGLPHAFHPDEIPKSQIIRRMLETGSFNPHYFLHPSLLLYLSLFMSKFLSAVSLVPITESEIILAGRAVSACAGTLSIMLVYVVGARLYGPSVGSTASLLFASFPLAITCSRYLKEDSLLVLFLLLCVVSILEAWTRGQLRWLFVAALCGGFAVGTKYTGLLTVAFLCGSPLLGAHPLTKQRIPWSSVVSVLPLVLVGFVVTTPYSVLAWEEFREGVLFEKHHMLRGHTESISAWSQWWMYHFGRSVVPGVSLVGAFLSASFLGLALIRRRPRDLLLVGAVLLFYVPSELVRAKPAPQPERYIVPCLPFLAVGIASFCHVASLTWGRFIGGLAGIGCLFLNVDRSVALAASLKPDTREVASEWIVEHLPKDARLILDFQPYAPYLPPGTFQVLNNVYEPVGRYIDLGRLRASGAHYVVLSSLTYDRFFSQPNQPPPMRVAYRKLFERLTLVKEFQPREGTYGFHNPVIRIYAVRGRGEPGEGGADASDSVG